jgi:hypothetical protein
MQAVAHKIHSGPVGNYESANSQAARAARERLQHRFDEGLRIVDATLNEVERSVPDDYLVPSHRVEFEPIDGGVTLSMPGESKPLGVHHHALAQLGTRAGIPKRYIDLLREEDSDLLAHNLTTRYQRQESKRYLARAVDNEVRGWLSSSYRRLDIAPLVTAFLAEAREHGAVPVDGSCLPTKFYLKLMLPQIFEPVPNEVLGVGAVMRSSDFGDGAFSLKLFIERIICTNGMVAEEALRKVHLGARLDDLEFSAETHRLDTQTLASATRDVVRSLFTPESVESKMTLIKAADAQEINIGKAIEAMRKQSKLSKTEAERCSELYKSPDIELLPPVRSHNGRLKRGYGSSYRLANAIGLVAHESDRGRALELEELAGRIAGLQ